MARGWCAATTSWPSKKTSLHRGRPLHRRQRLATGSCCGIYCTNGCLAPYHRHRCPGLGRQRHQLLESGPEIISASVHPRRLRRGARMLAKAVEGLFFAPPRRTHRARALALRPRSSAISMLRSSLSGYAGSTPCGGGLRLRLHPRLRLNGADTVLHLCPDASHIQPSPSGRGNFLASPPRPRVAPGDVWEAVGAADFVYGQHAPVQELGFAGGSGVLVFGQGFYG